MTDKPSGKDPEGRPKLRMTFAEGQLQGNYANLAMAGHSTTEFVLDFAFVPPGMPEARVLSRILMNPAIAKRFSRALVENLRRYEDRFGEIDISLGGPEPTLH